CHCCLGEEGINVGAGRVRHQGHVGGFDALPARDRGAVEGIPFREHGLVTHDPSAVTCCIFPLVSVNLRSRNFTSLSFIILSTSPTDFGLSAIATPLSSCLGLTMRTEYRLPCLPPRCPGRASPTVRWHRLRSRRYGCE